jgi:intracellular sulfur oxidation DsrE/DsrF family protein
MPIKLVRVSKDNSKAAQDCSKEWLKKLTRQVCRKTLQSQQQQQRMANDSACVVPTGIRQCRRW